MVPVLLASPVAVNWLLTVTIPWLVGSTVVGALVGRLSAENINNRDEIERQQAELNRLAAENQALAAHVKTLQVVFSQSEPVIVTLTRKGILDKYDLTQILHTACSKLIPPISKAIQELVGSFDPKFQERLRNNIILAGGGSRLKGIDRAIEKDLEPYGGGRAICVNDAEFCGNIGTLKMCEDMPEEYWEQL